LEKRVIRGVLKFVHVFGELGKRIYGALVVKTSDFGVLTFEIVSEK
jgi:hypothetical protein